MYQREISEIKEEFAKDYLRSRVVSSTTLYALLKKIIPFEEKFKKNAYEFNIEEALYMYKEFNSKSIYALMNQNTYLKAFCAWASFYKQAQVTTAYDEITIESLKPCVAKSRNKLLSRDDLTDIENQLYNDIDRAILECLWEVISGPSMLDLVSIEESKIDKSTKELYFQDGRVIKLTDRLYNLLIKALHEDEYLCYGETVRVKKLFGHGQLYKEMDNAHAPDSNDKYFRWVYRKVRNFRDHVGIPELTMKNISTSGLAHYLNENLIQTGLDLKSFLLTKEGEELAKKYGYNSEFYVDNVHHKFKDFV